MTRRVATAGLAIAAMLVGYLLVVAVDDGSSSTQVLEMKSHLPRVIEGSDAIVLGVPSSEERIESNDGWGYGVFSITIDDVVFQSETSLSEMYVGGDLRSRFGADARVAAETLQPGTTLLVHQVLSIHRSPLPASDIASVPPSKPSVIVLSYVDRRLFPEHPTDWIVEFIAVDQPLSEVQFFHDHGPTWRSQLALISDAGSGMSNEKLSDFLGLWLGDVDEQRRGSDRGSITASVDAALRSAASVDDLWRAASPSERPLDLQLTPASELADLVQLNAMVDIASPQSDREYLVIRNLMGVSHIARLSAGSHPVTLLAPPGADLVVELTNENGADALQVALIPHAVWGKTGFLSLVLKPADRATEGPNRIVKYRSLSQAEFQVEIDNFGSESTVVSGTQTED